MHGNTGSCSEWDKCLCMDEINVLFLTDAGAKQHLTAALDLLLQVLAPPAQGINVICAYHAWQERFGEVQAAPLAHLADTAIQSKFSTLQGMRNRLLCKCTS